MCDKKCWACNSPCGKCIKVCPDCGAELQKSSVIWCCMNCAWNKIPGRK